MHRSIDLGRRGERYPQTPPSCLFWSLLPASRHLEQTSETVTIMAIGDGYPCTCAHTPPVSGVERDST